MDLFIVLFVIIVGGCWLIAKAVGGAIFEKNEVNTSSFHITEIHHHHHEHKHINIIDEETKKSIFELRDNENKKAPN